MVQADIEWAGQYFVLVAVAIAGFVALWLLVWLAAPASFFHTFFLGLRVG
jgi:hypothetical protein